MRMNTQCPLAVLQEETPASLYDIVLAAADFHASISENASAARWRALELWLFEDIRHKQVFESMYEMSARMKVSGQADPAHNSI